jgi:hypothetical protein
VEELSKYVDRLKGILPLIEEKRVAFHRAAAIIVRDERTKGMNAGMDVDGAPFTPLKPATVRRKRGDHATMKMSRKGVKKGGASSYERTKAKASRTPDSPLIDTGALIKPTVEHDADSGRVVLAQSRSRPVSGGGHSISQIHQQGEGSNPKRRHWGIYPDADKRINKAFDAMIKDIARMI